MRKLAMILSSLTLAVILLPLNIPTKAPPAKAPAPASGGGTFHAA